ncbi:MAG TPA: mechanosensitive ion channel family protein [Bacteroidales bacterium]
MKKQLFFFFCTLFLAHSIFAQEDKTTQAEKIKSDSALNANLVDLNDNLTIYEAQRIEDSLLKVKLEQELQLVRKNDTKAIEEFRLKIKEIEEKDSIRKAQQQAKILILKTATSGFPVAPFKDTLFAIYSNIGPFSPAERAENINNKIKSIYKAGGFNADSLIVIDTFGYSNIMYNKEIITSLSDVDAMWYSKTRGQLASEWRDATQASIEAEIERTSLKNILLKIGGILLVLVGIVLLLYFVNKLFTWFLKIINQKFKPLLKPISIKNYELLSPDRIFHLIVWAHRIVKYFVFFIIVYLSLPIFLSIFPNTQAWADTLIGWVLSPVTNIFWGFVNYLPNLITIVIIFIATRYLVRFFGFLANEIKDGKLKLGTFYPDWALPTYNIVRVLLYALMFIFMFPYLPGSDSPIFKGVSVFIGVLFSLGSSSAISNMVAGLVITYMRPYKIGDRIKIGEHTGDVVEKTLLNTRLRTIKNEEITIPNAFVLSGQTINYSNSAADKGLILHTTITIGYDVNWRKMHEALLEAADRTPLLEKKPKPFVFQTSLDDFYVSYQINAFTKEASKQALIYSDLHANILDCCFEKGIEILSPHFRAERSGSPLQVPETYVSKYFNTPEEPVKKSKGKK